MAEHSEPEFVSSRDHATSATSRSWPGAGADAAQSSAGSNLAGETDISRLAAMFAEHAGGEFSNEFAANLALEIVLNEVVEQVCLATGATGSAIVMERDGEMLCRASNGETAPPLGTRFGGESGLSAECMRTLRVQRCDDALTDQRADMEAARSLGVRSIMAMPLLQDGALEGLLEIFSSRPDAFGDREENSLEAFGRRVLADLQRVRRPSVQPASSSLTAADSRLKPEYVSAPEADRETTRSTVPAISHDGVQDVALNVERETRRSAGDCFVGSTDGALLGEVKNPGDEKKRAEDLPVPMAAVRSSWGLFDYATLVLGVVILAFAVALGTLLQLRMEGKIYSKMHRAPSLTDEVAFQAKERGASSRSASDDGRKPVEREIAPAATNDLTRHAAPQGNRSFANGAVATSARLKEGELAVYEKGKQIFRLPADSGKKEGLEPAALIEREGQISESSDEDEVSVVQRIEPQYPEEARREGIQGSVKLELRIGADGMVRSVKVLSGDDLLAAAAVSAVQQWRFKPRLSNGRPVEMQTAVTLNFRLAG